VTPARNRVLVFVAAGLGFLLLILGALFAGIAVGKGSSSSAAPGSGDSSAPARIVPADTGKPVPIATCSLANLASASALQTFSGSVVAVRTGDALVTRNEDQGVPPAGGEKVITAAAAVAALGSKYRITTQVVDGATPGSITLIGQGDATLSRNPAGQSVYAGAPTLAALAASTKTAYESAHPGQPITNVVLDASYWDPNDNWESAWPQSLLTGGQLSKVTALQVDGDRQDPKKQISPRSDDPVAAAGAAFVSALGLPGVTVTTGEAENGAPMLAQVQSQPVSTLVRQMLLTNDDTLAEMLARIVPVKENLGGGSASIQNAIVQALDGTGPDASDLKILDGSGENPQNSVPTSYLASLLRTVYKGSSGMNVVQAGLSLAGKTGGLVSRFTGSSASGIGHVFAQPGAIAGQVYSLTGNVKAKDGTAYAFAFSGVGSGITPTAQAALDRLATEVYNCGLNLTNN